MQVIAVKIEAGNVVCRHHLVVQHGPLGKMRVHKRSQNLHWNICRRGDYLIEVPRDWNKTLFLYSHGYIFPDTPNPPWDNADPLVRLYLLSHGFALAGSSYASTGWAIQNAFKDQIAYSTSSIS